MKNVTILLGLVLLAIVRPAAVYGSTFIGLWDYNLKFYGIIAVDSEYSNSKILHNLSVLKSASAWYISISNDSSKLLEDRALLSKVQIVDPGERFTRSNSFLALKTGDTIAEFLPDGHWLACETIQERTYVRWEALIREHFVDSYFKRYAENSDIPFEYFEISGRKIHGIHYVASPNTLRVIRIEKYIENELAEVIFRLD